MQLTFTLQIIKKKIENILLKIFVWNQNVDADQMLILKKLKIISILLTKDITVTPILRIIFIIQIMLIIKSI